MLVRVVIAVAIIAAAAIAGLLFTKRSGRVRLSDGRFDRRQLASVGLDPNGADALALLLGSPTCAPCTVVKRVLEEVSTARPGLKWVYADAGDHLDLARAHRVMRVPTLFVLDLDGRILARTSGIPATRDLERVLDRPAA